MEVKIHIIVEEHLLLHKKLTFIQKVCIQNSTTGVRNIVHFIARTHGCLRTCTLSFTYF